MLAEPAESLEEAYEPFDDVPPAPPAGTAGAGARVAEDLRALAQGLQRLDAAYHKLSPALRDPEKLTLRYWRVQQRMQWVAANYARLLPEELRLRLYARAGRAYLTGPFDERVPGRRAVVNLRALVRDVLAAARASMAGAAAGGDQW